jgi:UDP-3-O-[3-hydroxymyristoyl] glucosamine N-acyltransferase
MIDPRFYVSRGPIGLAELFPGAEIRGDGGRKVASVAALGAAGPQDLSFFEGRVTAPLSSKAGAIVMRRAEAAFAPPDAVVVLVTHPRAAFADAARTLVAERGFHRVGGGVAPDAQLEPGVIVGPNATIGPGAVIGQGAEIGPGAVIGPGVRIGRRCRIGATSVVTFALVGDDVTMLAGAIVGQAGFGIAAGPGRPIDVPHFGRVIIEDRVTLGASSAVDRGLFDDTIVSEDAKIDNLTHIAHNVIIGRGVLIAAFGGIAGSSTIGDGAILGGRVGVTDHVRVGAGAQLGGAAVVLTDVPDGERWSGYPAKSLRRWLRELNWLAKAATGRRDAGG